ncbi:terpene synthase family protein [Saccharopolyspora gregorii]|uniref:terpene synthase family protein n=1 Tax=Saccharopolyspora gregorii TaxID=33914 RepID=UPI0021AD0211|nr:terpene synthase family protein [Saccharopolyspora gregorii]
MPELYFPFSVHTDIGHEEYDREAVQWLSRCSDLPQDQLDAITGSRIAAMLAFSAASARPELIKIFAKWAVVNLLVDDVVESSPIEQAAATAACGRRIWDDPATPAPGGWIIALMRQNTYELLTSATPVQRQRLRVAHQEYFAALLTQHLLDAAPQPPSLQVHTMVREATSGMPALSAVLEFVSGMEIPENEYHSPRVRAFAQAAHLTAGWINDICSFAKDVREGHQNNLVAVLAARSGCDMQEAVDEAVKVINSAYYVMDVLARGLLRDSSPALRGYVSFMLRKHGAFLPWQLNSPRYAEATAGETLKVTSVPPAGIHMRPGISSIDWWWDHLPARGPE